MDHQALPAGFVSSLSHTEHFLLQLCCSSCPWPRLADCHPRLLSRDSSSGRLPGQPRGKSRALLMVVPHVLPEVSVPASPCIRPGGLRMITERGWDSSPHFPSCPCIKILPEEGTSQGREGMVIHCWYHSVVLPPFGGHSVEEPMKWEFTPGNSSCGSNLPQVRESHM